jgi:hypothetical protein
VLLVNLSLSRSLLGYRGQDVSWGAPGPPFFFGPGAFFIPAISPSIMFFSQPWTEQTADFRQPPPDFANRLRRRRLQLGLTQKQAGLCVGASLVSFRDWELGKRTPGPGHLPALLLFLGPVAASHRRA